MRKILGLDLASFFLTGLISLTFFWAGSAYINQMYYLSNFVSSESVDVIAIQVNYSAQIIGAVIAVIGIKKNANLNRWLSWLWICMVLSIFSILGTFITEFSWMIIFWGFVMNASYGFITATLLSYVARSGKHKMIGKTIGYGYGFGTLASYLLTAAMGSRITSYSGISFFLIGLIVIEIFLVRKFTLEASLEAPSDELTSPVKDLITIGIVLILMAIISAIGGNYKSEAIFQSGIRLENTRLYYAVGLVFAGIISDMDRNHGAWLCIVGLFYPFVGVLISNTNMVAVAWPLSYFFLGFYTVYRSLKTVDVGHLNSRLIYFAGTGFIFARIGEVLHSLIWSRIPNTELFNVILIIALMLPMLYGFTKIETRNAVLVQQSQSTDLIKKFNFTNREKEVLLELLKGASNAQIASVLFISENTVKFHIKNILRKTNCNNRNEVNNLFR